MKKAETEKNLKKEALPVKKDRYFEGIGRRKMAVARVRVYRGKTTDAKEVITINGKPFAGYFPLKKYQEVILAPLKTLAVKDFRITVKVSGGGSNAQTEAVRLGLSRALISEDRTWRPRLKALGFLRRDPRKVERKKFGSRKARRPQQWRKR